jgi:hypothetical protein
VARIGAVIGSIWNQRSFQVNCLDLKKHSRWLEELQVFGTIIFETEVPTDEIAFKSAKDNTYHRTLVPYILFKTGGDLETTLEFAEDYRIESDFVYLSFVKLQLVVGEKHDTQIGNRFEKMDSALAIICNRELLAQKLTEMISLVSPYDYEGIYY